MVNTPFSRGLFGSPLLYILVVVDLILRGIALYKSARREQRVWFVALMIINSMGILPLVYLLLHKDFTVSALQTVATKKVSKKVKK